MVSTKNEDTSAKVHKPIAVSQLLLLGKHTCIVIYDPNRVIVVVHFQRDYKSDHQYSLLLFSVSEWNKKFKKETTF